MNQILLLSLNEHEYIKVECEKNNLENIVCCDELLLTFYNKSQSFVLANCLIACELDQLRMGIEKILNKEQQVFTLMQSAEDHSGGDGCCQKEVESQCDDDTLFLALYVDLSDNFSIEIGSFVQIVLKKTINLETLKAWVVQLELLHVLTDENDKALRQNGKGCC